MSNPEPIEVLEESNTSEIQDWLPRRGWWFGPSVVTFSFALGVLVGLVADDVLDGRAATSLAEAPTPAVVAPPPVELVAPPPERKKVEVERVERVEVETPKPKRRAKRARTTQAEEPSVAYVEVEVSSVPSGAWVISDGIKYGRTPLTVLASPKGATFKIVHQGYVSRRVPWSPARGGRRVVVELVAK